METPAMQEETIMIDNSSEAFAERLELCVLRSASFTADTRILKDKAFFDACFEALEKIRAGKAEDAGAAVSKIDGIPERSEEKLNCSCGEDTELCKLKSFWLQELDGLAEAENCHVEDLVIAWETTLQLLFEAESAREEGRPVSEKEIKDILYSYNYDYAEEFLLRHEEDREAGRKSPRRFVTELVETVLFGKDAAVDPQVQEGIRMFFGDRLKARLLETVNKYGWKRSGSNTAITGIPGLGTHQKKALAEFVEKIPLLVFLMFTVFALAACGGKKEEETVPAATEAADSYPGTVRYQSEDGEVDDRFGVMHATVLDVQKGEKDGLYVYTLRDEEDPENAWCLYSQDVGSIVAEMSGGKEVSVLFSGDIVGDPDGVEFIAILDDAPYEIKKVEGTTIANMMNSFTIRTNKGAEMKFIKDNCKVDRDALSTDNSTKVLIYYADFGGDKYPVRVYKYTDSRH